MFWKITKTNIDLRRNGKFTCLDCLNLLSKKCKSCVSRNWFNFRTNNYIQSLTYKEKLDRHIKTKESLA